MYEKEAGTHPTFGVHAAIDVHYTFTSTFAMFMLVVNDSQCIIICRWFSFPITGGEPNEC